MVDEVEQLKEEGNALYSKSLYKEAIDKYRQAQKLNTNARTHTILTSNICQASIHLLQSTDATDSDLATCVIQESTDALKIADNDIRVKLLYRRAQAKTYLAQQIHTDELNKSAVEDYLAILNIQPNNKLARENYSKLKSRTSNLASYLACYLSGESNLPQLKKKLINTQILTQRELDLLQQVYANILANDNKSNDDLDFLYHVLCTIHKHSLQMENSTNLFYSKQSINLDPYKKMIAKSLGSKKLIEQLVHTLTLLSLLHNNSLAIHENFIDFLNTLMDSDYLAVVCECVPVLLENDLIKIVNYLKLVHQELASIMLDSNNLIELNSSTNLDGVSIKLTPKNSQKLKEYNNAMKSDFVEICKVSLIENLDKNSLAPRDFAQFQQIRLDYSNLMAQKSDYLSERMDLEKLLNLMDLSGGSTHLPILKCIHSIITSKTNENKIKTIQQLINSNDIAHIAIIVWSCFHLEIEFRENKENSDKGGPKFQTIGDYFLQNYFLKNTENLVKLVSEYPLCASEILNMIHTKLTFQQVLQVKLYSGQSVIEFLLGQKNHIISVNIQLFLAKFDIYENSINLDDNLEIVWSLLNDFSENPSKQPDSLKNLGQGLELLAYLATQSSLKLRILKLVELLVSVLQSLLKINRSDDNLLHTIKYSFANIVLSLCVNVKYFEMKELEKKEMSYEDYRNMKQLAKLHQRQSTFSEDAKDDKSCDDEDEDVEDNDEQLRKRILILVSNSELVKCLIDFLTRDSGSIDNNSSKTDTTICDSDNVVNIWMEALLQMAKITEARGNLIQLGVLKLLAECAPNTQSKQIISKLLSTTNPNLLSSSLCLNCVPFLMEEITNYHDDKLLRVYEALRALTNLASVSDCQPKLLSKINPILYHIYTDHAQVQTAAMECIVNLSGNTVAGLLVGNSHQHLSLILALIYDYENNIECSRAAAATLAMSSDVYDEALLQKDESGVKLSMQIFNKSEQLNKFKRVIESGDIPLIHRCLVLISNILRVVVAFDLYETSEIGLLVIIHGISNFEMSSNNEEESAGQSVVDLARRIVSEYK